MLYEELKKIWRPALLLALLVLGAVFHLMFLEFDIQYFPNGPHATASFDIGVQLVQEYGTSLEPEEFEEFAATFPALIAEADGYIQENALAQKHGLTTYAAWEAFHQDIMQYAGELSGEERERYKDTMRIRTYLTSEQTNLIDSRIYATDWYIGQYDAEQTDSKDLQAVADRDDYSAQEIANVQKQFFGEDHAWRNILPYIVPEVTGTYFGHLIIWMALSVCILVSPTLVRDRLQRLRPLQWSTRRGRGIITTQFVAVMLSAFAVTSLNLLVFGGLFAANNTAAFAECRMFSFLLTGFSWVNWTYGGWCAALIVMCYLVSLGIAGIAFALSRLSGNYISMLLKLIPLVVVAAILTPKLIGDAFYYKNDLYCSTGIVYIEAIVAGAIFLLGMALCGIAIARQKKQDLLSA